ncbi:hypothetical protein A3E39_02615 [Candidatus Uhrbacteria bacterium RIFCSPHIGHO2_12_FULL_60_25]|uniref:Uncharacterized protein n=1 Tax=Candidatus Uhrbacteria bacterium RIFCSPHIGHO2_12_FULL_60_25 TaxID=1802399 RepID=A0A1F7UJC1_9BACT|nr:MAG: hypothetical protein A3E39_02615 [Candidatus Uhrbacteria bacterium RIFCSPHIGHO2_12_FULL_60_25]
MQTRFRYGILIILIFVTMMMGCGERIPMTDNADDGTVSWSNDDLKTLACSNDAQCAPYKECVVGGSVGCYQSHCAGFRNDVTIYKCVNRIWDQYGDGETPPQTNICGKVNAPPEQKAIDPGDISCKYVSGIPRPWGRLWIQLTADTANSTVTIHALNLYGVRADGTLVLIAGTDAGDSTITWFETNDRATWYQAESEKKSGLPVPPNFTFTVQSTTQILHMGNDGGDLTGFVDAFATADISTTGDAKGQIGIDFRTDSWNKAVIEGSMSDWMSCTTGSIRLSLPRASAPTICDGTISTICVPSQETCNNADDDCDGQKDNGNPGGGASCSTGKLGVCSAGTTSCQKGSLICVQNVQHSNEVCGDNLDNDCDGTTDNASVCAPPPPPPPPPSNGCPSTGVKITAGSSLLASCPTLEIVTWDDNGWTLESDPGQPLTISDPWPGGYAYVTTKCNGMLKTGDWPQVTIKAAGFSQICVQGTDVTDNTFVCWDEYSSVYRPSVPLSASGVGYCPP